MINEKRALPALLETLKDSKNFIAALADTAIDAVIDSGALGHIPVISWFVQARDVVDIHQLKKLQKNVKAFLDAASALDETQLNALHEQFRSDDTFAEEFTDTTVQILFESEKPIKAAILGRLISALARQLITKDDFDSLSLVVLSGSVPALKSLESFCTKSGFAVTQNHVPEEPLLLSLGIASRYGSSFTISDLGKKLYNFGF